MAVAQNSRGLWASPGHSVDTFWRYGSVTPILNSSSAVAVWPTANLIIYVPFRVKQRIIAYKLWFASGSAAGGGATVDIGIYEDTPGATTGTRIVSSGLVTKSTASEEQVVDITNTTIGPGLYYMALSCANGTDTFQRVAPTAPLLAAQGVRSEAGSGSLPATANWAVPQTLAYCVTAMGVLTEPTIT